MTYTIKKPRAARLPRAKDEFRMTGDDYGNIIRVKNNGKRIIVDLKLASENKYRRMGVITLSTKTIEIKRVRERHLFHKTQSYGFNHKLIAESKLFDKIRLKDDFEEWVIPKAYLLEHCEFLNFAKQGFELQCFLPLYKMADFKRKPKF